MRTAPHNMTNYDQALQIYLLEFDLDLNLKVRKVKLEVKYLQMTTQITFCLCKWIPFT